MEPIRDYIPRNQTSKHHKPDTRVEKIHNRVNACLKCRRIFQKGTMTKTPDGFVCGFCDGTTRKPLRTRY